MYGRVYRRLLPYRLWGGRIVFLRRELMEYFQNPPRCKPEEALNKAKTRERTIGRPRKDMSRIA
jgi:hypothetical protein